MEKWMCSLQLDDQFSVDCHRRRVSYSKLLDGNHTLEVCANRMPRFGCNVYNWTVGKETLLTPLWSELFDLFSFSLLQSTQFLVSDTVMSPCIAWMCWIIHLSSLILSSCNIMYADTVSPTASVTASMPFTSAQNVSVNITFTEPCVGGGGFRCSSVNACDVST